MARPSTLLTLVICFSTCCHGMLAANQTKVIEYFHVKSDIRYRLATTQIDSVVRNTGDRAQEIFFDVSLPKEAFITSFIMEIDDDVYEGEVKEMGEAEKTYTDAVKRGHIAGHIKQAARHANLFEVSVNVANGSAATFSLTYQEMLRRKLNAYQHEVHISPGQAVKDFLIEVFIQENKPLRFVKSPAVLTGSLLTNTVYADDKISVVDRPSANTAYITYRPSLSEQENSDLSARFIVEYDVEHSPEGDVLISDGYFVNFFAPDVPPMPKDIMFILDVSGSMTGQKIHQLQTAMFVILRDLRPVDRFNIIIFSYKVVKWRGGFMNATPGLIEEAEYFVRVIGTDGTTDINSALLTGISQLKTIRHPERASIIFFLTDGEPTVGVLQPSRITANILEANGKATAIFSLAFGKSADYDLLTTISNQNSGFAKKIYEDADAALQVASLYKEISDVSLKHLSFEYLPSSVEEYTVTNKKFPVVLSGSEVIVSGKLTANAEVFRMGIKGVQKSGPLDLVLEVPNVADLVIDAENTANTFFKMPRDFSGIVEKMWAYTTIKQFLKDVEIHASDDKMVEELKKKIIQIAIKYKFVTPLTSMVVTKPESPEEAVKAVLKDADDLRETSQDSGQGQHMPPSVGGSYRYAPGTFNLPPLDSLHHAAGVPAGGPLPMLMLPRPSHNHSPPPHIPQSHTHSPVSTESHSPASTESHSPASTESHSPPPDVTGNHVSPSAYDATTAAVHTKGSTSKPRRRKPTNSSMATMSTRPGTLGLLVSAISVNTRDLSVCLAPNKIQEGTYELIRTPNGTKVYIETSCAGKNCKDFFITRAVFENNETRATLSVNHSGDWMYHADVNFNITYVTPNRIMVHDSGQEIEVTVTRTQKQMRNYYSLDIKLPPLNGYTGLIGHILKMKRKTKQHSKLPQARMPAVCKGTFTAVWRYLNNQMIARYKAVN